MKELSGLQLGAYRLVRMLGEGGMGTVYEAVHESLGHRVAIKLLQERLAREPDITKRFENEARAAAIIRHPGIVSVFEFATGAAGQAYLVMEYLDGESLGARITRQGKLPVPEVLKLGRQVASILLAAHKKGVIHRDIKPDNIFLTLDPEMEGGERVKLLDFGIAKITAAVAEGQPPAAKTRTGTMMGTPFYMSPEQCRGLKELDGKADVYSLGAVLFQLLSGKTPFVAEGAGQLMAMHLREAPASLHTLDPAIDHRVSELVSSMLSKQAAARPSMEQVVAELSAIGAAPGAAGASGAAAVGSHPRRGLRVLSLLGLLPLTLLGALLIERSRLKQALNSQIQSRVQPERPVVPSAPIILRTEPSRAAVYRMPERVLLGHTPWSGSLLPEPADTPSDRVQELLLSAPGYVDTEISVRSMPGPSFLVRLKEKEMEKEKEPVALAPPQQPGPKPLSQANTVKDSGRPVRNRPPRQPRTTSSENPPPVSSGHVDIPLLQ